jgi:hypothetical protein
LAGNTRKSAIDAYTHVNAWISQLEDLHGRKLEPSDYIFPGITASGAVNFGQPSCHTEIQRMLDFFVSGAGLLKGTSMGKFTTHCLRRGGAQYRFMWAERKWSLKAIKWWGGWSQSETVNYSALITQPQYLHFNAGWHHHSLPS